MGGRHTNSCTNNGLDNYLSSCGSVVTLVMLRFVLSEHPSRAGDADSATTSRGRHHFSDAAHTEAA